jgi:hypothetical protein
VTTRLITPKEINEIQRTAEIAERTKLIVAALSMLNRPRGYTLADRGQGVTLWTVLGDRK